MPQIVMRDASQGELAYRTVNCVLRFVHSKNLLVRRSVRTLASHSPKECARIGEHRHAPHRPIFRPGFSVAAHHDFTRREVQVSPANLRRFTLPASGERRPPQEVGAITRAPRAGMFHRFDKLPELGTARKSELFRTYRHALQSRGWVAVNDARFNRQVEHVPQTSDRVVVACRGGNLAKPARPLDAIGFRDAPQFALPQTRPALEQRNKYLPPVMARARFDRHVVIEVLQMNGERVSERHFGRGKVRFRGLLLAMLAQEFRQSRFGYRKMVGAQALPNFFIVAERTRIVAAGLVTHQVLHLRFFPHLVRRFVRARFPRFASVCTVAVENDRRTSKINLFGGIGFPSKRAYSSAVRAAPKAFGVGREVLRMLLFSRDPGL